MKLVKCPRCQAPTPNTKERCAKCDERIFVMFCPECRVMESKAVIERRQAIDEIARSLNNLRISQSDARALEAKRERLKGELAARGESSQPALYPASVKRCPVCGCPLKQK